MPDLEVLRPAENARAPEPEGMTDLEAEKYYAVHMMKQNKGS